MEKQSNIKDVSGSIPKVDHRHLLLDVIMIAKIASVEVHDAIVVIVFFEVRIGYGTFELV